MMADGLALLAAVIDRPDDDGLRLIYADWLEENGRPEYARLIRDMIADRALRRLRPLGRFFPYLPRGFPIILADGPYEGPHGGWAGGATLRNGFIEEADVSWAQWRRFGPTLVRLNPVRHVHIVFSRPEYVTAQWSKDGRPYWYWDELPGPVARLVPRRWEAPGTKDEERRARKEVSDLLIDLARSGFRDRPRRPAGDGERL